MFDFVGIAVLLVLIALFGFLTARAWGVKNALLKWVGTVLAGLVTLLSAAVLALALIGFYKLNEHHDNPASSIKVAGTPEQIARGEHLAHACTSCHSPGNELPLSGTNFGAKFGLPPIGSLYAPNLTPSGDISDWTDGEVIRAIREGIHKNGRSLLIMPATHFRNMSDDDVQALVAYLRSQPPTGGPTPSNQFNLMGALFINLADFRTAQAPVDYVAAPRRGTPEYGKYMVDILVCRDCHGADLQGRVADGKPGPTPGPNLTKIVPGWTEEQFMTFFNSGVLPSGEKVPIITLPSGFSEPRMPWPQVRAVATDDELKDIYNYLHNLPPVERPAQ